MHLKGETLKNHRLSRFGNQTFGNGVQVAARHEIRSYPFVPTTKAKTQIVCFDSRVLKVFIRLNGISVLLNQAMQKAKANVKPN